MDPYGNPKYILFGYMDPYGNPKPKAKNAGYLEEIAKLDSEARAEGVK